MVGPRDVGVRELRQNLSKYLRRVASGESLRVTERGRPVAMLLPMPEGQETIAGLVAAGKLVPARLDLVELGIPAEHPLQMPISEALREQRTEK